MLILKKTLDGICKILKPGGTVNIVIQQDEENGFVSHTGVNTLGELSAIGKTVVAPDLLIGQRFQLIKKGTYRLPNGKLLENYDLQVIN
jgi:hypothetical protein